MNHPRRKLFVFFLIATNILTILGIVTFIFWTKLSSNDAEIQSIIHTRTKQMTFTQLSSFFKELSQKRGAPYAFTILKEVEVSPGTDLHLLGHIVGDELYKQRGIDGIQFCTHDFRNACSHSIVIGAFTKDGDNALGEIAKACENAPGGKGAYTMCFHGLGHGVLAYYGYDYKKMIESCKKTGTPAHQDQEFAECVGGAVMETVAGGGHDPITWQKQRDVYLTKKDPLHICSESMTPSRARDMCYTYITPFLWEAAGGKLGQPDEKSIQKAFLFCDAVDERHKDACYSAFGKEFIGLATAHDIREVSTISPKQASIIKTLCALAPSQRAQSDCVANTVGSLFWGGENNPRASILFCNQYDHSSYENSCYSAYIGNVKTYNTTSQKEANCNLLPAAYKETCTKS